jgi:hypothetical protein
MGRNDWEKGARGFSLRLRSLATLLIFSFCTLGHGLGYSCRSTDGYSVIVEHKAAKKGKREPIHLIISRRNMGTLITVHEEDIFQQNLEHYVEYAAAGNAYVEAAVVAVQIRYSEGRVNLPAGESTTGNLILQGKRRRLVRLICFNYVVER